MINRYEGDIILTRYETHRDYIDYGSVYYINKERANQTYWYFDDLKTAYKFFNDFKCDHTTIEFDFESEDFKIVEYDLKIDLYSFRDNCYYCYENTKWLAESEIDVHDVDTAHEDFNIWYGYDEECEECEY